MNISVNPKVPKAFASSCLDRTVKMWSLGSPNPTFTTDIHDKAVNYVDFYAGADRPYLATTSDDKTIRSGITTVQVASRPSGVTRTMSCSRSAQTYQSQSMAVRTALSIWNSGTYRSETPSVTHWNARGASPSSATLTRLLLASTRE